MSARRRARAKAQESPAAGSEGAANPVTAANAVAALNSAAAQAETQFETGLAKLSSLAMTMMSAKEVCRHPLRRTKNSQQLIRIVSIENITPACWQSRVPYWRWVPLTNSVSPPTPPSCISILDDESQFVPQSLKLAKQTLAAQEERLAAQKKVGVQQDPRMGLRLTGEETVLVHAPVAYPLTMTPESQECLHQGLRIVHVLAQHLPNYLEVRLL